MSLKTAKEISLELRIPLARVYELARLRQLPVVRLGERQLRFDLDAIRDWVTRGGVTEADLTLESEASDGPK